MRARAARAKEEAAREAEVFAAERPLKPLRKLRPSALVQHVPVLLQAISHHRWPVRALGMELLAKCPADALAPTVPALLSCLDETLEAFGADRWKLSESAVAAEPPSSLRLSYSNWIADNNERLQCQQAALHALGNKKLAFDPRLLAPRVPALTRLLERAGFDSGGNAVFDAALELLCVRLEPSVLAGLAAVLMPRMHKNFSGSRHLKGRTAAVLLRRMEHLLGALAPEAMAPHLPLMLPLMKDVNSGRDGLLERTASMRRVFRGRPHATTLLQQQPARPQTAAAARASLQQRQDKQHAREATAEAQQMGKALAAAVALFGRLPCAEAAATWEAHAAQLLPLLAHDLPDVRAATVGAVGCLAGCAPPYPLRRRLPALLLPRLSDGSVAVRKAARAAFVAYMEAATAQRDMVAQEALLAALPTLLRDDASSTGGGGEAEEEGEGEEEWRAAAAEEDEPLQGKGRATKAQLAARRAARGFAEALLAHLLAPPPADASGAAGGGLYEKALKEFDRHATPAAQPIAADADHADDADAGAVAAAVPSAPVPPAVQRSVSAAGTLGVPPRLWREMQALDEKMLRLAREGGHPTLRAAVVSGRVQEAVAGVLQSAQSEPAPLMPRRVRTT